MSVTAHFTWTRRRARVRPRRRGRRLALPPHRFCRSMCLQRSATPRSTMANIPYRDFAPAYQDLNQGRLLSSAPACDAGRAPSRRHCEAPVHHQPRALARCRSSDRQETGYPDLTLKASPASTLARHAGRDSATPVTDVAAIVADPDFRPACSRSAPRAARHTGTIRRRHRSERERSRRSML